MITPSPRSSPAVVDERRMILQEQANDLCCRSIELAAEADRLSLRRKALPWSVVDAVEGRLAQARRNCAWVRHAAEQAHNRLLIDELALQDLEEVDEALRSARAQLVLAAIALDYAKELRADASSAGAGPGQRASA